MSQALRDYRRKHGIPLDKLAADLGIQRSGLCKWERKGVPAHRVPTVSKITGLAFSVLRPDVFGEAA